MLKWSPSCFAIAVTSDGRKHQTVERFRHATVSSARSNARLRCQKSVASISHARVIFSRGSGCSLYLEALTNHRHETSEQSHTRSRKCLSHKKTDPGTRRDEGLAVSLLSPSREEMRPNIILRQIFHPQKLEIGLNPWIRTDTVG